MNSITALLELEFFGNPLSRWLLALLAFTVTFTILPLIKRYASSLAQRARGRLVTAELILRMIPRTSRLFILVVALNAAERSLRLPEQVHRVLTVLIVVGVWYQLGLWALAIVEYFTDRHSAHDAAFRSSMAVIRFLTAVVVWALVILLALDNLEVNVTTLVAGLGIGGIAVALAVQTILGDLLASLSIALDKPFTVGDQLTIDDFQGAVEYIGIKSTRLRSVSGEQIILSNADILKSRVRNFGRMPERRGIVNVDVAYETPHEKLALIVEIIRKAIQSQESVRLERCNFKNFGPSALEFDAVYFVSAPRVATHMEVHQAILMQIHESFANNGIQFAYPTQRLLLERMESRGKGDG